MRPTRHFASHGASGSACAKLVDLSTLDGCDLCARYRVGVRFR